MGRAVIYCRISRDPEGNLLGVTRQERECRELCDRLGLTVVAVEVDDDQSAYRRKPRPAYRRVIGMIEAGEVDTLVAWHADRLTRQPVELEELVEVLDAHHVDAHTVVGGHYDLSNPGSRMVARQLGVVAAYESEMKSRRLKSMHRQRAERGLPSGGGSRPYGYACNNSTCATPDCPHDGVSVIEGEAAVIRRMVAEVLAGRSLTGIARDLNNDGFARATGKAWTATTVTRLLQNARNAGLRDHPEVGHTVAAWPAIFTPDQYRQVVARLTATRQRRLPRRYLLNGLLFCSDPECGSKLVPQPKADGRRCYVCPHPSSVGAVGCGKRKTLADPIEELVIEGVFARLDGVDLAALRSPQPDTADRTTVELERIEGRLRELGEMWARGEIDRAGWSAARRVLEDERSAVQATISRTIDRKQSAIPTGSLRKAWPQLSFDRRYAILRELIDRIELGAAVKGRNSFDPSRVHVTWKV